MFTVNELLKAAQGRLLGGSESAPVRGISIDSRTIKPGEAFLALRGENFDGHNFIKEAIEKGARCIIGDKKLKGYSFACRAGIALIEVKDATRALGDIARFQREKFAGPVIAVCGSNGKTTTKEMLAWVLAARYKVLKSIGTKNNQVGLPLALLGLDGLQRLAVVEMGTNHFGEVDYLAGICRPNIGIITNIGPAHLEHFKDLRGVLREKSALIGHLQAPRILLLNADDNLLRKRAFAKKGKVFVVGFGINNRSDYLASEVKILDGKIEFLLRQKYKFTINTRGYYNIYNALAAIAAARLLGMGYGDIARRLSSFIFPQGRLRLITLNRIRFIDDTYNSNPLSLRQALDALGNFPAKGRKIFVMGDMQELGRRREFFHRQAGQRAAGACDVFITVGKLSRAAAKAAELAGLSAGSIFRCSSNLKARHTLFYKLALGPDDIVLVKGSRAMKMEEVFKV